MAIFPRGFLWPDAIGTPTDPTVVYTPSAVEFETHEHSRIFCMAVVDGLADPGLLVRLDVSLDGGTQWLNGLRYIAIPGAAVGAHYFWLDLPHNWHAVTYRLSAADMRGVANTTVTIYGEAVVRSPEMVSEGVEDQPIELTAARVDGVAAWHNGAGAAAALGLNFALGPPAPADPWWIPVGRANYMQIWATTTNGPPTSIEFTVDVSQNLGVNIAQIPAVNSVVAGIENLFPLQVQMQSAAGTLANGTYKSNMIPIDPGSWVRLQAKRTGAAVNCLASIRLFREC